jgi:flagellar hook-associated protein 1 FlgK
MQMNKTGRDAWIGVCKMASGFLGLTISLSGLFANQRSLAVVSHNIANASTEGYSRQVMNTIASSPEVLPGSMGTVGTGVEVTSVEQVRDAYLDSKYRDENSTLAEWEARADVLAQIENIFNEPSDSSIGELLDSYYEALQTLSTEPENLTARTLVRQTTIALTEGVGIIAQSLKDLQSDLNYQFTEAVDEVNSYAEQIAQINEAIYKAELEGGTANDLRDQRNLLVDKLSELVPVDYYEDEQNRFYVLVGGHQLVAHYRADSIEMVERTDKVNEDDGEGLVDIKWADGNDVNVDTGQLAGLLAIRDNIEGDEKGIPYYIEKLNEFVDVLSNTMNEIHETGYGLDESTGYYMFTIDNMSTEEYKTYLLTEGLDGGAAVDITSSVMEGVSALDEDEQQAAINANIEAILANNPDYEGKSVKLIDGNYYVTDRVKATEITIASDLEDLNKIAASADIEDIPGGADTILDMVATRYDTSLYDWGAPEDFIKSLVSNLGVDAAQANRMLENQESLVNEYETSRQSIQGVSLDEEMANMIKYQTAYNANARMINVFDEMLDLIVNRLGTSGR